MFDCAHDIKQKINYERRQARLRQIESDFNHEIVLVDPNRSFVREGQLVKMSNNNTQKQQLYTFFLFNDLMLYASEGINSKWKCHRVIHLSLCRIDDLRGIACQSPSTRTLTTHSAICSDVLFLVLTLVLSLLLAFPVFVLDEHAFRIVSPQKSFIVSAPDKARKAAWLQAIVHHLEQVMAKRKKYIQAAKFDSLQKAAAAMLAAGGAGAGAAAAPASSPSPMSPSDADSHVELLRRYSTFIGQSDIDLNRSSRQESNSNLSGLGGIGGGGGLGGNNIGGAFGASTNGDGSSAASPGAKASNHCKLCIRPWAIFRRKQKCRWCGDSVCNDCCTQKCQIPGGEKRQVNVCDACFGVLKGTVGSDQPVLTVCDL